MTEGILLGWIIGKRKPEWWRIGQAFSFITTLLLVLKRVPWELDQLLQRVVPSIP
jgi:hypothetical protein